MLAHTQMNINKLIWKCMSILYLSYKQCHIHLTANHLPYNSNFPHIGFSWIFLVGKKLWNISQQNWHLVKLPFKNEHHKYSGWYIYIAKINQMTPIHQSQLNRITAELICLMVTFFFFFKISHNIFY